MREHRTPREDAQPGADVEAEPADDGVIRRGDQWFRYGAPKRVPWVIANIASALSEDTSKNPRGPRWLVRGYRPQGRGPLVSYPPQRLLRDLVPMGEL
jgi:hypothetical protein